MWTTPQQGAPAGAVGVPLRVARAMMIETLGILVGLIILIALVLTSVVRGIRGGLRY